MSAFEKKISFYICFTELVVETSKVNWKWSIKYQAVAPQLSLGSEMMVQVLPITLKTLWLWADLDFSTGS